MTTDGECSKFVSNFVDSLKKLQEGADGSYPKEISDECIFSPSNVKDRRLQSVISQVAIQRHVAITRQEYINSESHTTSDMAWLEGISSEEGSLWLDTIPYKTEMEMKPQIFKSAIRYRYRLAQSTIIPGTYCNCKRNDGRCPLDVTGLHLSTHCTKNGYVVMTHDNIKFCLNNILRQAGRRTKIEERHCFTMAFPDNNSKPDITMINSPFSPNKELVIDVTIAAPIPGEFSQQQLSKEAALIPLRAANAAFQKKNQKYLTIANSNNLDFLPFVIESTGKIHPDSLSLLQKLSQASEIFWRIPQKTIYKYWLRLLSITLQRSLITSILERSHIINGSFDSVLNDSHLNDLRNARL